VAVPETGGNFAAWLRDRINARGLTQEDTADLLGVSRQAVAGWLRGTRPQRGYAERARKRLGVSGDAQLVEGYRPSPSDAADLAVEYRAAIAKASAMYDPIVAAYEELLSDSKQRSVMARDRLRELSRRWRRQMADIQQSMFLKSDSPGKEKYLPTSTTDVEPLLMRSLPPSAPSLGELLSEVRDRTDAPGARKALAGWLGVTQSQLSKWLSLRSGQATYAPSATNALKLLDWVVRERRAQQKQGAEAVRPASAPTTQRRRLNDEKTTPSQHKVSRKRPRKTTKKHARRR